MVKNPMKLSKERKPSRLELEVNELSEMPDKLIKITPHAKVLCKVINALSPSEIWVQDIADSEGCYSKFQDILNESYKKICEENQISNDSWQVNDICVIKIVRKNVFHRAKIFEKTKIEKFNVILLDKGVYEYNVEKSQIFKLINEFKEKPEFKAKKCTVVGVHPSGTTNGKWSSLAQEFTANTLDNNYVHVEFKSGKKPDDSYDTCIYIDTKKRCEFTLNKSETKEFVRFAEILNRKGLAFLEEKTESINMLLAHRNELKERFLLSKEDLYQSYIKNPILPESLKRNCHQKIYDALITHVDSENGVMFLHFFKDFNTIEVLSKMQKEFQSCFNIKSEEDIHLNKNYKKDFLLNVLANNSENTYQQALVCKIEEKFYRCKILKTRQESNDNIECLVNSIDYGFTNWIKQDRIYRPMIKFQNLEPQAAKFRLTHSSNHPFENNHLLKISDRVQNKHINLKVNSIIDNEEVIIEGDFFERGLNAWCIDYLSGNESIIYDDDLRELNFNKIDSFSFPINFEENEFSVIITWEDFKSNNVWLQLDTSNSNDSIFNSMENEFRNNLETKTLKNISVEKIVENQVCCSVYCGDNQLYRAIIKKVDFMENFAIIQFIDYGNDEEVNLQNIYELESKYLDIPMNSLCCSVDSLNIHENLQVDERFEWQNKNDIFEVLSRIGAREKIVATFHRKVESNVVNKNTNMEEPEYSVDLTIRPNEQTET